MAAITAATAESTPAAFAAVIGAATAAATGTGASASATVLAVARIATLRARNCIAVQVNCADAGEVNAH